ncbi:MAG TPA: M14 family metallopeptidase, partial [Verrucomicrobiae bacterium]|nr:M14 family metallopeptidase [Verrucomicrobiae bacterium]
MTDGSGSDRTLVISSGVHGPEGFFGSAVQLALLERWRAQTAPQPSCRIVLLHALNPYGFAARRRFNEQNVDLNRNFLLAGESYSGAPAKYGELNGLLNPARPPARIDLFPLHALLAIARYGVPTLMQTIAAGQYDYPRGLFFGGQGPAATHTILHRELPRWLSGSAQVVHLDFHTGLGKRGTHKLLIDYPLNPTQRKQLTDWYGPRSFVAHDSGESSYTARGGFGHWCVHQHLAPNYLFATAEFGTYSPAKIVAGLRRENQAHHYGRTDDPRTERIKAQLVELFCPRSSAWRNRVVADSLQLVEQAVKGLES